MYDNYGRPYQQIYWDIGGTMDLKELFQMQEKLDNEILDKVNEGVVHTNFTSYRFTPEDFIVDRLLALQVEVSELANATRSFKYWSEKESEPKETILDEYVDVLHFWLSVGLALNFTPDDVIEAYKKKNKVNFERINNGY